MKVSSRYAAILVFVALICGRGEIRAQKAAASAARLTLAGISSSAGTKTLINPGAPEWQSLPPARIALNRTPKLYETEPPSELEIPELEVRTARTEGKLIVRLSWRDPAEDTARIAAAPGTPTEGRFMKEATEATNRFFDAAAVMFPAGGKAGTATPSLQMGDAQDPVAICYWNAARGAMLMEAKGRETTRRTGLGLQARALYQTGFWNVSFDLPDLPHGTPLAFAIWNGSQQDRDGRKYFSVWHWLE